jgi:hypothetical protein
LENEESDAGYFGLPKLLVTLIDDVTYSFSELENHKKSQYLRRNTVRATFSFIEGICSIFLNEVRLKQIRYGAELSGKEKKSIEGDETELVQRIKKAFSSYTKLHSVTFSLDTSTAEFDHLKRAKDIRNRLVHPKRYIDIVISDDDMSSVAGTYIWVKSEFLRLVRTMINENIESLPEEMREEFRATLNENT